MRFFTMLWLTVILVLGILFAILNAELVSFNYLFNTQQLPLSLLLFLVLGLGVLLGLAVALRVWLRLHYENNRLKEQLKKALNSSHLAPPLLNPRE